MPLRVAARPEHSDAEQAASAQRAENGGVVSTNGERPAGREGEIARGPGLDAFRGRSRLERAILPFLREPTLWPVLVAVLAHAVALGAPLLVAAWRTRHGWSIAGLVLFASASTWAIAVETRDRGRPRAVSALILVTWALCGAGAWAAVRFGIL